MCRSRSVGLGLWKRGDRTTLFSSMTAWITTALLVRHRATRSQCDSGYHRVPEHKWKWGSSLPLGVAQHQIWLYAGCDPFLIRVPFALYTLCRGHSTPLQSSAISNYFEIAELFCLVFSVGIRGRPPASSWLSEAGNFQQMLPKFNAF